MARVPYLTAADVAPADRDLLARDLNLYRAIANSPAGTRAFAAPALYVRHESRLDPRLRELAILQVGYVTNAKYEYAHHIEIGRGVGLTDDDIRAIALDTAGEKSHLSELEHAVLAAAREIASHPALSDETFATLKADLDDECIVDLIIAITFYCGVVRLLGVLQIDLEDDYEKYLEAFPLPS
jgi:alkylhydroperoxidase family enzyme